MILAGDASMDAASGEELPRRAFRGKNRSVTVSTSAMPSTTTPATDYEPLRAVYAAYAPEYDRKWGRYTRITLQRAIEAFPRGARSLMDVGCGTGVLAEMLRSLVPGLRVIGVDASPEMLARAREKLPPETGARWEIGQAEALPEGSPLVEVVTCTNAFHLVQRPDEALREFHRVLAEGGRVIIVDWCRDYLAMRVMARLLPFRDAQPRSVRGVNAMTDLLQRHEFVIERAERFRATWFWGMMLIVARKQ